MYSTSLHTSTVMSVWLFSCFKVYELSIPTNHMGLKGLTLCWAQRPKMSLRGRGQNVPKCPVAIGKLCCFHTRKFSYNLTRISWIITVWDIRRFLPRHLHCLFCPKRKWESFLKSSRNVLPVFETGLFNDSDNDERFYGFRAEDIVLWEAVADSNFDVNDVSSVHTSDWSNWQQRWLGRRYRDRNGWSQRTRPIDDRFTVRIHRKNKNKHRFGHSRC